MPWQREEVAPYCYENVYRASSTEKVYYSTVQRTREEMKKIEDDANRGTGNAYDPNNRGRDR
jgi:hypothetical protein